MADARIEIKVGAFSFSGEGTEKWLSGELEKLLVKIPELADVTADTGNGDDPDKSDTKLGHSKKGKVVPLATFLKEKSATTNQVKKFLATAVWLHDSNKQERLTSGDVKTALKTANQNKLTNPANCLNQNAAKGFCEKDGSNGFFVTDEGRESLG
jgi:hypothetical protein